MADVNEYNVEVRQFCIEQAVKTPMVREDTVLVVAQGYYNFIMASEQESEE